MTQKPNPLSSIKISGPIPAHLARSVIEETLRNAILDGRLPCGTAMRQQELASLFGVSRMPVREALRQLEAQSLLHVVTHKGAVVAPLIEDNSAETYALRMLLESEALRLSIPLLTDADQFEDRRGHCLTMVGGQLVEAFDIGVAAVGRHLPVDVGQDLFDFNLDSGRSRKTGVAYVLDRPGAAHGRAAEGFQGIVVAAAGQGAD